MDDYEGADEGFRGSARREDAHRPRSREDARSRDDGFAEEPGFVDREPGARPMYRFPIAGYGDPADSLVPPVQATGEVELPHWAAAPTGEVPLIVPTRRGGDDAMYAAAPKPSGGAAGVGWRDREADWDDPDYEPARLGGRDAALGALDEDRMDPDALFSFDTFASLDDPPAQQPAGQAQQPAGQAQQTDRPGGSAERRPSRRIVIPGSGDPRTLEGAGSPADRDPEYVDGGSLITPGGPRSGAVVRTATGIGIGVALLIALKVGPAAALALVIILVTMAAAELYGVLRKAGYQPATLVGLVATICLMVAEYLKGAAAIGVVVVVTVAVCLLWYLWIEKARSTANLAATVLGFFWVGLLGSFAALLLSPALFPDRHGEAFFLGAVIATVAYDVGALVVGSKLGRHPLAPSVSPNKTWEGMVGGTVTCLIISALIVGRIHPWGTANAIGLGILVCVVAPLGDLCESVVKRDLGVKDMGSILPGHGGVLDRLDALLFVVPATYFLVRLLHIGVG
jgi:phosphatidate cytidylyltransferase